MKYMYSAIALIFLLLLLDSRTDPLHIKTQLDQALPTDVVQASSGMILNATFSAEGPAQPAYHMQAMAPIAAKQFEQLCLKNPTECEKVIQWIENSQY